jgi:hypothetical protein
MDLIPQVIAVVAEALRAMKTGKVDHLRVAGSGTGKLQ